MTATTALADTLGAAAECDEVSCREATSHVSLCECRCGGIGHGTTRGFNHVLFPRQAPIPGHVHAVRVLDAFAATAADDAF